MSRNAHMIKFVLVVFAALAVASFTGQSASASNSLPSSTTDPAATQGTSCCHIIYGGGDPGSTYKGNPYGYTHCFITWDHFGCQMNHYWSTRILDTVEAGNIAVAASAVCDAVTGPESGGLSTIGCWWAGGAVGLVTQGFFPLSGYNVCLEVGFNSNWPWSYGPYAKMIPCTVE